MTVFPLQTQIHPLRMGESASRRGELQLGQIETGEILRPCRAGGGMSGTIRLPYKRFMAGGPARPTGVFLGGGPGVSNLDFTPPREWLELMDVVVLEYRGVGRSSPVLDSPFFARAMCEPITSLSLSGASRLSPLIARGFADLRAQGVVFEDFGLGAMADDIEAMRLDLGLGPVLLIAHSFGTRVAQAMQTRHRDGVRASLLLGNNSPDEGLIWMPGAIQAVWERWARSSEAASTALGPQVSRRLLHGWDRGGRWTPADSQALIAAFFMAFSNPGRLRAIRMMLRAQAGPSPSWRLMSQFFRHGAIRMFNWADFFVKGYVIDAEPQAVAQCDAQGPGAMFASPSSVLFSALEGFHEAGGRREAREDAAGAAGTDYARTLLVTGEFDPTTPIERWPVQVPPSHRVVLPGAGHAESLAAARQRGHRWIRGLLASPEAPLA